MKWDRSFHSCSAITTASSSINVLVCGGIWRRKCEIYDPDTNSWTTGPSLPSSLDFSAMVPAKPKSIYAAYIFGAVYKTNPEEDRERDLQSGKIYGVSKDLREVTELGTFDTITRYVAVSTNLC